MVARYMSKAHRPEQTKLIVPTRFVHLYFKRFNGVLWFSQMC